jgi:N-acylglucosamine-6-phosphate 2-epimerase
VLADIATVDEALTAADAGADFVLSTLRGYSEDTSHVSEFDAGFIRALARQSPAPVIAEGMIETPEQARAALDAGAYAVVVGSAITRPTTIARRFAAALEQAGR